MMKLLAKAKNILSVVLMLCILTSMVPAALADSSFKAVVTSKNMKVYSTKGKHKYLGSLPKGTVVTVKDYAKGIAKISYKGNTGLAYVKNMEAVEEKEDSKSESTKSTPAVALKKIKIYKKANTSSKYVTVAKGTEMNVLSVSGKFAKVEKNGVTGYALKAYLGDPDSIEVESKKEETSGSLKVDVVSTRSTRVYRKASTSSSYVTVPAGTEMTVIAVNGDCAKVEKNGAVGYAVKSHLTEKSNAPVVQPDDPSDAKKDETPSQKEETSSGKQESSSGATTTGGSASGSSNPIFNGSYSNEQITYMFLTKVMGYNTAAAIGVMANIKYESGYKPVSNGDSGSSYGICQWHAGRKTRLINWCNENGYDHATLEGQLYYLQYDLTHSYTKVHKYLSAVENTAEGAYDAGYYFCYHFVSPSSKATKSITRGEYARDTLWPRYGG